MSKRIHAVQAFMATVHDLNEVEQLIAMLGSQPDSGMIVSAEGFNFANRKATYWPNVTRLPLPVNNRH